MIDDPRGDMDFRRRFASESLCEQYLTERRWPEGFECPKCGGKQAWRTAHGLRMCSTCGHQASLTAGTRLHRTKLTYTVWCRATWVMLGASGATPVRTIQTECDLPNFRTGRLLRDRIAEAIESSGAERDGSARGERFRRVIAELMRVGDPAPAPVGSSGSERDAKGELPLTTTEVGEERGDEQFELFE